MAIPLIIAGAAALGAAKAGKAAHAANKANKYQDAVDETERKRANASANLFEAPQIHGAEQRKTFGNNFGLGILSNFGRDAKTGSFRAPWFKDMTDDAWKYRPIDELMAKHPTTIKGPSRPKTSVLGSSLMGAGEGAISAWMAGGGGNPFKSAPAASSSGSTMFGGGGYGSFGAPVLNPSARFEGFNFVMPGQGGTNPFLNQRYPG